MVSMAEGESLNVIWDGLPLPPKNHVHAQSRKAVSILRRQSVHMDCKHGQAECSFCKEDECCYDGGCSGFSGVHVMREPMMSSINLTC